MFNTQRYIKEESKLADILANANNAGTLFDDYDSENYCTETITLKGVALA
ncbi:MAG: hypothetical protein FWE04_01595 [Oscillospiraceae bacterium]|nr:hypothetical protein [Oscillospiraceae bacterium]